MKQKTFFDLLEEGLRQDLHAYEAEYWSLADVWDLPTGAKPQTVLDALVIALDEHENRMRDGKTMLKDMIRTVKRSLPKS